MIYTKTTDLNLKPCASVRVCFHKSKKDMHKYCCGKDASHENKLVLNVMNKKKCVLHFSALKFCLWHLGKEASFLNLLNLTLQRDRIQK